MEFISGITAPNFELFGMGAIFKALFLVLIFGYLVYTILLTLRVRILNDTVHNASNKFVTSFAYIHLLIAIVGSLFAVILILLG